MSQISGLQRFPEGQGLARPVLQHSPGSGAGAVSPEGGDGLFPSCPGPTWQYWQGWCIFQCISLLPPRDPAISPLRCPPLQLPQQLPSTQTTAFNFCLVAPAAFLPLLECP